MSDQRYNFGDVIKFKVTAEDSSGDPIGTADMVVNHYRDSDDKFWNGSTWQTARYDFAMTPNADTTNYLGEWSFEFDTGPHEEIDTYNTKYIDLNGNAANAPWNIDEALVGGYLDELSASLARILALQKDNFVLEPLSYNTDNIMTTGRIRCYDSAANTTLNNGVTGLQFEYDIVAQIVDKKLITYTETRVL